MIRGRTDKDMISNMVYSAMETGNHVDARRYIAEHRDTFPGACADVCNEVWEDYGVDLA